MSIEDSDSGVQVGAVPEFYRLLANAFEASEDFDNCDPFNNTKLNTCIDSSLALIEHIENNISVLKLRLSGMKDNSEAAYVGTENVHELKKPK